MLISEIKAVLDKAAQVAGDADVILHDVDAELPHIVHAVEVLIPALGGSPVVKLVHGPAPQTPPPTPEPAPVG